MADIFRSKISWMAAVFVAAVVFLIGVNLQKSYQSEMRILILPKSNKTSINANQIIATVQQIPLSLSFYDKMLELNTDIEDEAAGLPDYKRKNFWNSKIKLERVEGSNIIHFIVDDRNIFNAEILSTQTANSIAVVMSHYYDIKNDLEIRIIDGPIVKEKTGSMEVMPVIYSLIIGFFSVVIAYYLYFFYNKINLKEKFYFFKPSQPFRWPKTKIKEEAILSMGKEVWPGEKSEKFSTDKKNSAPSNLPVGSDFILQALERTESIQKEKEMEKHAEILSHEPTVEEVKERLNKLLRGKI